MRHLSISLRRVGWRRWLGDNHRLRVLSQEFLAAGELPDSSHPLTNLRVLFEFAKGLRYTARLLQQALGTHPNDVSRTNLCHYELGGFSIPFYVPGTFPSRQETEFHSFRKMRMNSHIDFQASRLRRVWRMNVLIILAALSLVACKGGSSSVISEGNPSSSPSPAASVQTASNTEQPASAASPAAMPTTPVGPVGQTTPGAQPNQKGDDKQGEKQVTMGNIPMTVGPAKPALTPAPDPFPPRPTPTVVMENGKIKQQWQAPPDAASLTNPFKGQAEAVRLGRDYYMQKCVDCHGKEGRGNGWMSKMTAKPPTNLASQMVQANSDGELYWKITKGRSPMPAHGVRFSDEQRWYIVNYVRTFKP